MRPIAPRVGSSSPTIPNRSDIQETSSSVQPAQASHLAHTEEMPPARQDAVLDAGRSPIRGSSSRALVLDAQGRLVVVSNRLIDPKKPAAGGLAVALGDMMRITDGLWMGCRSKETNELGSKIVRTEQFGRTTLVQVEIPKQQYDNYYAGFSNSVLWPIFHGEVKKIDVETEILIPAYFKDYEEVNKMLASHLAPMLKGDDTLWIHDYHLIPFAQELRALGCEQRIGFFNHTPLPPPDIIKQIPQHKQLMEALFSYDLIGMQRANDVENLCQYVEMEGVGQRHDDALVEAFNKMASVQDFPIGIDVENLKELKPSGDPASQAILDKVRNESGKRMLIIGVDRLDYSKGIPRRLKAFRDLLKTSDDMLNKVTFVQVAAPTRPDVQGYAELSEKTQKLVDEINREFGTDTWTPVLYFNQGANRNYLPELYRLSRVCAVTPVADGMNLVAKEYIAAQEPSDPGVLVLSEGAGAASQLHESLLVPPKDRAALAKEYKRALTMPLPDRQKRHDPLMKNVETENLSWWRERYLAELSSLPSSSLAPSKDGSAMAKVYERSLTMPLDAHQKKRSRMSNEETELASSPNRD